MEALADASECRRDHDVTPAAQLIRGVAITPAPMPCSMYKDKVGHHILPIASKYFWTIVLLLAAVMSTSTKPGTSPRAWAASDRALAIARRRLSVHGSARITLCTPRADKRTIRRHEPCEHRRHELDGLDLLAMLLRKNLGVGDEIAMHGARKLDGELDRPVIRNGGKPQLGHRSGVNSGKVQGRGHMPTVELCRQRNVAAG